MNFQRTPAQKKAQELAIYLRNENPDFNYLRSLFKYLCQELRLQSPSTSQHSREIVIPTSEEIQRLNQPKGWYSRTPSTLRLLYQPSPRASL